MAEPLRIALAQANLLVGDIAGNAQQVIDWSVRARDELAADLIVFPELTLTGYPPEDLLLRPGLYRQTQAALDRICQSVNGIDIVIGLPQRVDELAYNAAVVVSGGAVRHTYYKHALPNYTVFDEKRYFEAGSKAMVFDCKGHRIGLTICEDIWHDAPVQAVADAGAECVLNLNASPYHMNKWTEREQQVATQARTHDLPIAYVNLVGGQDELVFDGHSFVVDAQGELTHRLPAFEEALAVVEITATGQVLAGAIDPAPTVEQSVYQALLCGVRDYVDKNHFPGVVIGLSGGIDSGLTLAIAADALGAERVEAVMMPSPYTRQISLDDAAAQAEALGVRYSEIPIGPLFDQYRQALSGRFAGLAEDVTEENLQARIRGNLLMAISNKTGAMVLTTGNKSEMAVGYATLYGDMAGGFAAIKDVPKTLVYRLARYRNSLSPVIPERVITRAPSAELAPDQLDSDSLPDYDTLDAILLRYVEQDACVEDIVAEGFDESTVLRVAQMVQRNEYKRRQAAPGVRITPRAFGRDRRYPITSGFKSGG